MSNLIGHNLDVVYNCESDDVIRLEFPVPIVNGTGPEVWVTQAFGPDPINRFAPADISVDGITYHRIQSAGFAFVENEFGQNVIYWIDFNHNGFFENDERYQLKEAFFDLSNLGVGDDESVSTLWVRGVTVEGGKFTDDMATDYVMVGNLNDALCTPDFTGDGTLDIFDVLAFLDAFNAGDPIADFTADGAFDIFDVLAFLDAFNAGCP